MILSLMLLKVFASYVPNYVDDNNMSRQTSITQRLRTYGPKEGYCSICRNFAKLTKEHIPPKSCGNIDAVRLKKLLSLNTDNNSSRYIQGGLNFKSTCANCNNYWLGDVFGPSLTRFTNDVANYAKGIVDSNLVLPDRYQFVATPQKVARAVIGNILAANSIDLVTDNRGHFPIYKKMQDYFFNVASPLPENITIYYWFYPSKGVQIFKAMKTCFAFTNACISYDVIKFFPLAYMVVWKQDDFQLNLDVLVKDRNMSIETKDYLTVNFSKFPSLNFPETPGKNGLTLFNDSQTVLGNYS